MLVNTTKELIKAKRVVKTTFISKANIFIAFYFIHNYF